MQLLIGHGQVPTIMPEASHLCGNTVSYNVMSEKKIEYFLSNDLNMVLAPCKLMQIRERQ